MPSSSDPLRLHLSQVPEPVLPPRTWGNLHNVFDKQAGQTSERVTFARDTRPLYLTLIFSTTQHVSSLKGREGNLSP